MVKQSSSSINSSSEDVKLEAAGRATRRAHVIDEAVTTKPDDSGLEYGAKVRDAIKRSAT